MLWTLLLALVWNLHKNLVLFIEEPGGLQFIGLQSVGHDWGDLTHMHAKTLNKESISAVKQEWGPEKGNTGN